MTKIIYKDITLKIRSRKVLDSITLRFDDNQIIGVVGDRNSGKNYLLTMIPSFRYPSTGTLTLDGIDVFENSDIMTKVVYTWPAQRLHNSSKVIDGLKFCQKLRPKWDMEYAFRLLDMFALSPKAKLRKLSHSQRSLFNTIIGLAARAPVTIFDGTHLRLQEEQRELFYTELQNDQKEHPRMIIISSYEATEMEPFIDEILILHDGKVIGHESKNKIISSAREIMGLRTRPSLQEVYTYFTKETGGEADER